MAPRPLVAAALPALLCAACLFGCSDLPPREVGFDSSDPAGRVDALRDAAASGDRSAIPGLIGTLRSDDPAQRMLANRALIGLTGRDFGFDHAADQGARDAGAERWRAWWASENGGPSGADAAGYPPASPKPTASGPGADPQAAPGR